MKNEIKENNYELFKSITKLLSASIPENEIVEYFLNMEESNKKVKPIGDVKDMKSEFKNDVFEKIYEDQEGNIVDVRFYEKKPTEMEIKNLNEYWVELYRKYNKDVLPVIIVTGDVD